MTDPILYLLLAAPALAGLLALVHALTRADDRIQLATFALFAAAVVYFAQAYESVKEGGSLPIAGVLLGAYSLFVYLCMAALALGHPRWAWRAGLGIFALHIVLGLFAFPAALEHGFRGAMALVLYLALGAVGIWALWHPGSRRLVASGVPREA